MAAQKDIIINDFNLFEESIKAVNKMVPSCKMSINQNGLTIYSQNTFARSELTTDSISSSTQIDICIRDLPMLLKLIRLAQTTHPKDSNSINIFIDGPFLKFESKKFKTKISTIKEDIIQNMISTKIQSQLIPVFEFKTSSDTIKNVNSYQFIFSDLESGRIYLKTDSSMENNVLYAELNNKSNDFSNAVTLKLGDVVMGSIDRELVIDFDRLMLFNIIDSKDITIQLMDRNVLISDINITTKKNNFMFMKIYNSLRKS